MRCPLRVRPKVISLIAASLEILPLSFSGYSRPDNSLGNCVRGRAVKERDVALMVRHFYLEWQPLATSMLRAVALAWQRTSVYLLLKTMMGQTWKVCVLWLLAASIVTARAGGDPKCHSRAGEPYLENEIR
jgi:hypothetical protein